MQPCCCTCEAAAPSESSSCSLVVPFEDLGTVLPFHLGDNQHQHSAAFVNRVRYLFEFAFLTCKTTFTRSDHCLPLNQSVSQSVSLFKVFFFNFFLFVSIVLFMTSSKLIHGFLQKTTPFLAYLRIHFLWDPSPIIALSWQSVTGCSF